jgi:hypothetical protein
MNFKILLIAPYNTTNIINDNIDINVVLPSGDVYFATLFTIANIQSLLKSSTDGYFNAADMIIVEELTIPTIRFVVNNIIQNKCLDLVMSKIGVIKEVLPDILTYEEIEDFGCPVKGIKATGCP